jgi:hypothetical protein
MNVGAVAAGVMRGGIVCGWGVWREEERGVIVR